MKLTTLKQMTINDHINDIYGDTEKYLIRKKLDIPRNIYWFVYSELYEKFVEGG